MATAHANMDNQVNKINKINKVTICNMVHTVNKVFLIYKGNNVKMLKNVNNDYVKNVQPDLYCQLCDMAIQQYVYVMGYIFNKVTWVNMAYCSMWPTLPNLVTLVKKINKVKKETK